MHEAKMHRQNCFLTLTLRDEHLTSRYFTGHYYADTGNPVYAGTLDKSQMQRFWKRLRKALAKREKLFLTENNERTNTLTPTGVAIAQDAPAAHLRCMGLRPIPRIRYYMSGEYGEKYGRPHYHACVFGYDFDDKIYWCKSPTGEKLYRSATLERLWPYGFTSIGAVTFESAAYVARYVMKKITGQKQEKHYEKIDQETGEIIKIIPEYNDMSRGRERGEGIGGPWLKKYAADAYPHGQVVVRGKECMTPRYYDKQFKNTNREAYDELKLKRNHEMRAKWTEQTEARLAVREQVAKAQLRQLKRKL